MKKEDIRKEFFKLKIKDFSYSKCKILLKAKYDYEVSIRTFKRWNKRLDNGIWDLKDLSRRPKIIHYKITPDIEKEVIKLRNKTGWGQEKLYPYLTHLNISKRSVKRIIKKHNLCRETKTRGKRVKWIRWQRKHPNSLWQIDHTDEQDKFNCYTLSVIDDCSRYSLAIVKINSVTTNVVIHILDNIIKTHGKPREILTDNGSEFGLNSKHSKFDRWCRRRGILHIRTRIHSPTTSGKVERLFKTMDEELDFCNNDLEIFRMRYNHFRPHSSLRNKTPAQIYHNFASLF
ncbi:DDE-type integrase/transposase/recombinase [Candidatus Woesearchaeota archaeon]|nr:DDE-type integrase/transposase/recombinase [Candidatus Woesearchaeota archaeon]